MRYVAFVSIAVATALLLFSANASAGRVISRPDGTKDIQGEFISFLYRSDGAVTFSYYGVGGDPSENIVFQSIYFDKFSPLSEPSFDGPVLKAIGEFANAEAHDNPYGTISFHTVSENSVSFTLAPDTGAIPRGKSAVVGKEGLTAELIYQGEGEFKKEGQSLSLDMLPGESFHFRVSATGQLIGDMIVSCVIAGEIYLTSTDLSAVLDVVKYQDLSAELVSSSSTEAAFEIDGELRGSRVLVLSFDRNTFTPSAEDLEILLDGESVRHVQDIEEVFTAQEAAFVTLENPALLEVYLSIPHFSFHSIVVRGAAPPGVSSEMMIASLASLFVVAVAAVFLFRRRD